jgi:hypothetical protein
MAKIVKTGTTTSIDTYTAAAPKPASGGGGRPRHGGKHSRG